MFGSGYSMKQQCKKTLSQYVVTSITVA